MLGEEPGHELLEAGGGEQQPPGRLRLQRLGASPAALADVPGTPQSTRQRKRRDVRGLSKTELQEEMADAEMAG